MSRYEAINRNLEWLEHALQGWPIHRSMDGSWFDRVQERDWEQLYMLAHELEQEIPVPKRVDPPWNGVIGPGSRVHRPESPMHDVWDPIHGRCAVIRWNILKAVEAVTSWQIPYTQPDASAIFAELTRRRT